MGKKSMNIIFLCWLTISMAVAQKTAIYRDMQADFKKGMQHFESQSFGLAKDHFQRVIERAHHITHDNVPTFVLQSELHDGLSSLYLEIPDAEKKLVYFMERYEPNPVANLARLAIGDFYYKKKKYDNALAYYSKVTFSELNNDEIIALNFKMGYAYFVRKKFKESQVYFAKTAMATSSYELPSNYYLGMLYFFDEKYDQALVHFKKVESSPRYARVIPSYLCQIYFAKKDYDQVISTAKVALQSNSTREKNVVSLLLGQSYYERGLYKKALPYLEKSYANSSKVSSQSIFQLGYTLYKLDEFTKAINYFEQLDDEDNLLGQTALYYMADCELNIGKKEIARQAFQQVISMDHDPVMKEDAMINFAKLSYELGYDNDAIKTLLTFQIDSDYYNEAQQLLSTVFLNTRDYDKALAILREMKPTVIQLRETWQKIAYFRGVQHYNARQYHQAIQLFNESLNIPINQEIVGLCYFWRAEAKYKKKAYQGSIKDYLNYETIALNGQAFPDNASLAVCYYGIGYNYLKSEKHQSAARFFEKSVKEIKPKLTKYADKYVTNFVYPDALLRTADCFIYVRNYDKAKYYYNVIIAKKYPNKDYALFQKSVIHFLQDKPYEQLATLDKLINDYPSSSYADDALFTKGNTLFILNKKELATTAFKQLLSDYPDSDKYLEAQLKLGLIAYSLGDYDQALIYYQRVFKANPQSEEASDALATIREIYISSGNPNGYFDFVNSIDGLQIDEFEKDSILFHVADVKYQSLDYQGAVTAFDEYLSQFPDGLNALRARFYRAESLFDLKEYARALDDYDYLSVNGNLSFAETANHRASQITYFDEGSRDFTKAEIYFERLEKITNSAETVFEAQLFGLRSAFYGKNYTNVPRKADALIANLGSTPAEHAEAYYFKGVAYVEMQNYTAALPAFEQNIQLSGDDEKSAESRYWRAYITYLNRDLDKAMDYCFKVNQETPNHPYWVVKAFILLADIYAEKDNLFQAKATLQSIIDNYDGDQNLLNEAKAKLQAILDAEKKTKKRRVNSSSDELEMLEDE